MGKVAMMVVATVLGAGALAGCKSRTERHCEQAYTEMNQFMAGLTQRLGGGNRAPEMPRDQFMAACRQLPPEAAQCAVISYSLGHQAECAQHRDRVRSLRGR